MKEIYSMCIFCVAITSNGLFFVVVTYKFLPRTTYGGKMTRKMNKWKRIVRRTILVRRVTARRRKRAKKMEVRKLWSKYLYWRTFVLDLGVLWISQIIVWFKKKKCDYLFFLQKFWIWKPQAQAQNPTPSVVTTAPRTPRTRTAPSQTTNHRKHHSLSSWSSLPWSTPTAVLKWTTKSKRTEAPWNLLVSKPLMYYNNTL